MSLLRAENLTKGYLQGDSKIRVIEGLNLDIESGESVAILGQSGSGKSTLLSLLAGLDQPDSGFVELVGKNLNELDEKELSLFRAKNLAIVFQQFHLFPHLNALENVEVPLELLKVENSRKRALDALEAVGLSHRLSHFPSLLSGGERQRVAIARAFAVSPKILLADEPSGNLDQETGDSVMNLLFAESKNRGMTLVLVTHNDELAKRCTRRLRLSNGRLEPC